MRLFKDCSLKYFGVLLAISICTIANRSVWAQVSTAAITGSVVDTSGAAVPSAAVTVTSVETGSTRAAVTDESGFYRVLSLPVGKYDVKVEKTGFSAAVQTGINLVVGQQALVNLSLKVGTVSEQVTVTGEAPLVNATTASISGLVGEQQVKELPLNGRSFDNLLTLNPAASNYSPSTRMGSASGLGSSFSLAGRRQWENLFLLNGIEYTGASVISITPGGVSGQLLGIDAIREFNVVSGAYSAEYGKRSGGQISIVTQSGTNQIHGTLFEFLRNGVLDARNYFDQKGVPPFKRNQFGAALGGPIKKERTFLFGNYEAFRQRLGLSILAVVPDENARKGLLPCGNITPLPADCTGTSDRTPAVAPGLQTGMLPFLQSFWPLPNGSNLGGGVAQNFSNPNQVVNEDFGTTRGDQNISNSDTLSGVYTIDNGQSTTPLNADPLFAISLYQRSQVASAQETHIFTPQVINTFTAGMTRAVFTYANAPTVAVPANLSFVAGNNPGSVTIGGSAVAGNTLNNGVPPNAQGFVARSLFTYQDGLQIVKGSHQFSVGGQFQRIRSNERTTSRALGQAVFTSFQTFLQGTASQFSIAPNQIPQYWRSSEGAWYAQDSIRVSPRLTVTVGLRHEFANGWNEDKGKGAIYKFDANGVYLTDSFVVSQIYPENDATKLFGPRVGIAWDPFGKGKTSIRAGWGIYYNLIDSSISAGSTNNNQPYNGAASFSNARVLSLIPFTGGVALPPQCAPGRPTPCTTYDPRGNESHLKTPTVGSWNLTIEQQLTANTVLRLGYLGSSAFHQLINVAGNTIRPQICSNPAGCVSGGIGAARGSVPSGAEYIPVGTLPNPFLASGVLTFFRGNANYNAMTVDVERRMHNGLQARGNYTWSKNLDLGSGIGVGPTLNTPMDVINPQNLGRDYGPSPLHIAHQVSGNFSYELPFGSGKQWANGISGPINKLIGGWQLGGIVSLHSGFTFSPLIGANRSGNGDQYNPDRPSLNPSFTGKIINGTQKQWYNPGAFVLPTPGTFGNLGRANLEGPGMVALDFSLLKRTSITERVNLEFRSEFFNILNRTNFGAPNPAVFSGANLNPAAGLITTTATTSRQMQFGLKLRF